MTAAEVNSEVMQTATGYSKKMSQFNEELSQLKSNVSSVVQSGRVYAKSGSVEDAQTFFTALKRFSAYHELEGMRAGACGRSLHQMLEGLTAFEDQRRILLQKLLDLFVQPMEKFLNSDIRRGLIMEGQLKRVRDNYDAAKLKYDIVRTAASGVGKKRNATSKLLRYETELLDTRKLFELFKMNFLNQMDAIKHKTKYETVDRLASLVYATLSSLDSSQKQSAEIEPAIRDLMSVIERSRSIEVERMAQLDMEELVRTHLAGESVDGEDMGKQGYVYHCDIPMEVFQGGDVKPSHSISTPSSPMMSARGRAKDAGAVAHQQHRRNKSHGSSASSGSRGSSEGGGDAAVDVDADETDLDAIQLSDDDDDDDDEGGNNNNEEGEKNDEFDNDEDDDDDDDDDDDEHEEQEDDDDYEEEEEDEGGEVFDEDDLNEDGDAGVLLTPRFKSVDDVEVRGKPQIWKRSWLVVSEGFLYMYRNWKERHAYRVLNLRDCWVDPVTAQDEKAFQLPEFCISVRSPTEAVWLKADGTMQLQQWVAVIENGIALQRQMTHSKAENILGVYNLERGGGPVDPNRPFYQFQQMSESNKFCADCGARDPDWASIRTGVLVCYECAGLHRSAGLQVRPTLTEKWPPESLQMFKNFANDKMNLFWEASYDMVHLNSLAKKPRPDANRMRRERFIRAKYIQRAFVVRPAEPPTAERLLALLSDNRLVDALKSIAQGLDPATLMCENGQPLLHYVISSSKLSVPAFELLLTHGASIWAKDSSGSTALHIAAQHDRTLYAKLLLAKGASLDAVDSDGRTPEVIAKERGGTVQMIFSGIQSSTWNQLSPRGECSPEDQKIRILREESVETVDRVLARLRFLKGKLKERDAEKTLEILKLVRTMKTVLNQ